MTREIYLAGGCFWGAEHFLKQIQGVVSTEVGFANGHLENPTYKQVYTDTTGHAETVHVTYDPAQVSLKFLLELFFKAIDPTSLNKQGEDTGTRYRTGVYYTDPADLPQIEAVFAAEQQKLDAPLMVEKLPLQNFYRAEEYHQDYLDKNPTGYCHLPTALFEFARKAKQTLVLLALMLLMVACGGTVPDPDPGTNPVTPPIVRDVTVGITRSGMGDATRNYYIRCLAASGASCRVFPQYTTTEELAKTYVDQVDAIIIPGSFSGDTTGRGTYDYKVIRAAIAAGKPLLGICQGHQSINKVLGGTTVLVSTTYPNSPIAHKVVGEDKENLGLNVESYFHSIHIDKNSRLAALLKDTVVMVNTSHNYSSVQIAPSLKVTARADDGVVEALEGDKILCVQFHPEVLYGKLGLKKFLPIFQNLTDEARAAKAQ